MNNPHRLHRPTVPTQQRTSRAWLTVWTIALVGFVVGYFALQFARLLG